mmetsp:Transcript_137511/g.343078  ORF Transcript_137511/g.343078 Transcript_137511/m.343078 type:complete len:237 (+) Transcript_137511:59-769(+)
MQNFFKCCASIAVNRDMNASGSTCPREAEGDADDTAFAVNSGSAAEGVAEVSDQREMKWQERPGPRPGDTPPALVNPRKVEPATLAAPGEQASLSPHGQSSSSRQTKLCMDQSEEDGIHDAGKEERLQSSSYRGRSARQASMEDKAPTGRALSPESAFKEPIDESPAALSGGLRLEYMADCKDNSQSKRRPPQARKVEPKFEQAASSSSSPKKQVGPQAKDIGQQPKDIDLRPEDM